MNSIAIKEINTKLNSISDLYVDEVLEFLEFINYKDSIVKNKPLELTESQIRILDERSKTPIDQFIPREKFMSDLKIRHGII
jgi:hypothetical protein